MKAARFARAYAGAIFGSRTSIDEGRRKRAGEVRLNSAGRVVFAEALEARRLLSSVSFSSGVWTLNADSTAETIRVYRVVETSPASDQMKFEINTTPATIYSRDTSTNTVKIVVNANHGNDIVHVETQSEVDNNSQIIGGSRKGTHGVNKAVEVDGYTGNDTVYGGDQADTLSGNDGEDRLHGRNGGDSLFGNADVDEIYGDAGNDTIHGGAGDDWWLDGGDGDDVIYGGAPGDSDNGADTLIGGLGNDSMYGGGGNDYFSAFDFASDYLDGGDGSDTAGDHDSGTDSLNSVEIVL